MAWKDKTGEERLAEIEKLPEYRKSMTVKAIASMWGVSEGTVKYWLKQLFVKRGVKIEGRKLSKSLL